MRAKLGVAISEVKATSWVDPLFGCDYSSQLTMLFPRQIRRILLAAFAVTAVVTACNDANGLPDATVTNRVDTVTLYALRGTDVHLPSGYDVPNRTRARTDLSAFDFAFDIDTAGRSVLYPAGALGLAHQAGIFKATQVFDSVLVAPDGPYTDSLAVPIVPGFVFVVRSRPSYAGCELIGQLPRYAKFSVLSIDPAARSLTLQGLVNLNCGYRGLEPGVPKN
jgi:hypothetical protein